MKKQPKGLEQFDSLIHKLVKVPKTELNAKLQSNAKKKKRSR